MNREADFSKQTRMLLEQTGCKYFSIVASLMQTPGIPDKYYYSKWLKPYGGGVWVELKWKDGKLRTDQKVITERLHECGVAVCILRCDGSTIVDEISGEVCALPVDAVGLRKYIERCLQWVKS